MLTLTAQRALTGMATGTFASVRAGVRLDATTLPDDAELLGFAFTQFALPVFADRTLEIDFAPAPGLHAPECVLPLLIRAGDACALIAPLTNAHEQIIEVRDGALIWGWHGDLDDVPAGFSTTARIYRGSSPTEVFDRWGDELLHELPRWRDRSSSPVTSHLSYWTDNGAAYWYRTEPDRTIAESVVDVVPKPSGAGRADPGRRARLVVLPPRDAARDRRGRILGRRAAVRARTLGATSRRLSRRRDGPIGAIRWSGWPTNSVDHRSSSTTDTSRRTRAM